VGGNTGKHPLGKARAPLRERGCRVKSILTAILLLTCVGCVFADAATDVPRDHWAYQAVEELANKGYVLGYPDGSFLGNRSLTRYEFATIVKRILDDLESRMAQVGAKAGKTPSTSATVDKTPAGVSQADLDKVTKLVDEFKVELTVIGTRVEKVEQTVEEMRSTVEKLDAIICDPEGAFEATKDDVKKLKKVGVSGYVQARYTSYRSDPNSPTAHVTNGQYIGRNFNVRRARIKVTGKPSKNSSATVQIDCGQNGTGTNTNSVTLKDAFAEYFFKGNPALGVSLMAGQFKWPFGYEVVQSSSVRETPERSLIVSKMFPGERDKGIKFTGPTAGNMVWNLGLFNGTGTNNPESNASKDVVANVRWKLGDLDFGASGYWGRGVTSSSPTAYQPIAKNRWGVDLEWYFNNVTLKAEYITGKGVEGAKRNLQENIPGYWAQLAWNLNMTNTLVAKYEWMKQDPTTSTDYGERSAWNLGLVRWMDDKTRFKVFYIINKEELNSFKNDGWIAEWITTF